MAEDDSARGSLIPAGSSIQPSRPPIASRPESQAGLILFALVCSNIFALFVTLVFEFLSLRGVVDVNASRLVLVLAWGSGVVIICAFAWGKRIRARWRTVFGGSLLLAVLLWGLDIWAPKPEVIVDPSRLLLEASESGEVYSLTVRSKVDFTAYSVQVKMKFSQASSSEFSFDTPSPKPIIEGSSLTDIQGLRCADPDGHAVVMFWIYRMEPGTTREITITRHGISNATMDSKVTYFTSKQLPRSGNKAQATGVFHFDEPMTCNGDITFRTVQSVATAPAEPLPVKPGTKVEPVYKMHLSFKDSPALTPLVKRSITKDLNGFYEYLTALGFVVSSDVPPIGVNKGSGGNIGGTFSNPVNPKLVGLWAGSDDIVWGARDALSKYVFEQIIGVFQHYPQEYEQRFQTSNIFAEYFSASFVNKLPDQIVWSKDWVQALWEIRSKYGKAFVDRSMQAASSFMDDPNFARDVKPDLFLYLRFRYGEQTVTDDSSKLIGVDNILAKHHAYERK